MIIFIKKKQDFVVRRPQIPSFFLLFFVYQNKFTILFLFHLTILSQPATILILLYLFYVTFCY